MNPESDEQHAPLHLFPLTRKGSDGAVYQRDPAVETQIRDALALPEDRLLERIRQRDYTSGDYLQHECLVYLIRHYHRLGSTQAVRALCKELLGRCAKGINDRLETLGTDGTPDAFGNVVEKLFALILDLESNKGDFLQVRFFVVLNRRIITNTFNDHARRHKQQQRHLPPEALAGYEKGEEQGDGSLKPLPEVDCEPPEADAPLLEVEQRREMIGGLAKLPEPLRTAFILRHYEGWQIESQDPSVKTISGYFDKTPRTIRTWLQQADEILAAWREKR